MKFSFTNFSIFKKDDVIINAWKITFNDLLSLLLIFFILSYSSLNQKSDISEKTSNIDQETRSILHTQEHNDELLYFFKILNERITRSNLNDFLFLIKDNKSIVLLLDMKFLFLEQKNLNDVFQKILVPTLFSTNKKITVGIQSDEANIDQQIKLLQLFKTKLSDEIMTRVDFHITNQYSKKKDVIKDNSFLELIIS